MPIEIFDNDVDSRRRKLYLKARLEKKLEKLFLGDGEYLINSRDSYFNDITDIVVLIERCLYPLFLMGDKDIVDEVTDILQDFSKSDNIIKLHQVVSFINYQKESILFPKEFAFYIDFNVMLPDLVHAINSIDKQKLETVLEKNIYEFVLNMSKVTPMIQQYFNSL
ncbi:NAD glycohydrolase toxin immunity factor [Streptococcus fryi]